LCLHGIEAHGLRFIGLAQRLGGVTVVAPDLRGHGRSPKAGPWTMARHLADLEPLLESLGPRTVLLGHSYGGRIAWDLARAAPDRLAGLILVDPALVISAELADSTRATNAANLRWPDAQTAFSALVAARAPSAHWSVALDTAVWLEPDASGWLQPMVAAEAVDAGCEQMRVPLPESSYGGPVLLLEAAPETGLYISPVVVAQLREQLGDRLRHVALDTPHTVPADAPDLLARHVADFLAELDA
jgi:lipase